MPRHNVSATAFIGARAVTGLTLLGWPRHALSAVSGDPPDDHATVFARVLGVRHLLEAAVLWRWTTPAVLRAGATVDAVHGVSAAALVTANDHRRLATLNAGSAATWSYLGFALARRMH